MTLMIREADVARLVTIDDALVAVERAFRQHGHDAAPLTPRQRVMLPQGVMHLMGGAVIHDGYAGLKTYTATRGGVRFLVVLFSAESGELLALIEADLLGRLRTGAASGVATRYLARPEAATLGVFGVGGQARTQVEAVCAVRPMTRVLACSRTPERLATFCAEMSRRLDLPVEAVTPQEAGAADVVVTITSSRQPVLLGEWLSRGTHINAAGVNWADRREIDDAVIQRCTLITIDSLDQGHEAGDLLIPIAAGKLTWDSVTELSAVIAGKKTGRTAADDITLFKSLGIAIEDVALAADIYQRAVAEKVGEQISLLS